MVEFQHHISLPLTEESQGHHYGNFHKYYEFHNPSARYSIILDNTFQMIWNQLSNPNEIYLLDIGCNEGNLTVEMLQLVKRQLPTVKCTIIGIDIDEKLINKAKEKYNDVADVIFIAADCLIPNTLTTIMMTYNIEKFALITAFSITMWIHMNHGDLGLIHFLELMGQNTSCGILIEPQKWISYRKAMQRCRRMKIVELPHYQDLLIHDIENYSEEYYVKNFNMKLSWRIPCEEWGREALLFIKTI